jgi:hypothetical protein
MDILLSVLGLQTWKDCHDALAVSMVATAGPKW